MQYVFLHEVFFLKYCLPIPIWYFVFELQKIFEVNMSYIIVTKTARTDRNIVITLEATRRA